MSSVALPLKEALFGPKPVAVAVIGWLALAFGVMGVLGGLFGTVFSLAFDFPPDELMNGEGIRFLGPMKVIFDYYWAFCLAQLAVSALLTIGGLAFLRLQRRGRAILEGLTWFYLVYNMAFTVGWVLMVRTMMPVGPPNGPPKVFVTMMTAAGVGSMLVTAAIGAFVIYVLRSARVRNAMVA